MNDEQKKKVGNDLARMLWKEEAKTEIAGMDKEARKTAWRKTSKPYRRRARNIVQALEKRGYSLTAPV